MNSTVEQLKEVLNMPNPQNFKIKTNLGQRCKRCPGRCQQNHYTLDREYGELKVVISNMRKYKEPMECFKHSTVTYHPPHNCNKNRFGYDPENEDDKSEEQDKINKMSGKIQKYLNKEFKGKMYSEYPKEEIGRALDCIVPPELTDMIIENIEEKELTQVIPIRTINDTIEWTEEIRQPWELNGEFTWPEEELLENPIPMMNIIQEDKRIIELQNHIAKLENEIAIKDQLNEGLRIQLDEKQYELNETARMCNENATMVMNAQEWIKYFRNKYVRRNKRVNELKKRGNILLTKYVDKNNDLKDKIEELEQEINFGNVLFNQIIDLNMTINADIDVDPSIENMEF
ncbi:unnamed protein product [Rhizophagus irregularis]|nr:unnamed protein product [Rhizophagus irregularis]